MNELIKELAKQAKKCAFDAMINIPDRDHALKKYAEAYDSKFAELVIAECVNKIEIYQIPVGNSSAGEMACEWTYAALKEIRDNILELSNERTN